MELTGDEPRMIGELDDLDEAPVRRLAGQDHAGGLKRLAVAVVHLEAMAVSLVDDLLAVYLVGLRTGRQPRRVQAEAQPEVRDLVVASEVCGEDLALDTTVAEAARYEDAGHAFEPGVSRAG